ncbi:hypothetical protein LTR56_009059 [Elasticomyces elasticus]|nr:hypothetical protein LTR56_009059 [Elasticomyces elasticus]KAK3663859.1 hypothetical protein LTR22_005320 [Elasticomyces elasticus]KAK4923931.1 hypothetical protein LTR49_008876 [Elasticomyces elasticus]KAK5762192.1 hypothetical protein LTS12_007713 [Elasticomyces elasticus]
MEDVPKQQHLMPAAIDYRAKHTPDRVYAVLPKGERLEDGFADLTYAAFARAIDATAWWLDEVLGAKAPEGKFDSLNAVPYIGPNDFRYVLFTMAAMKTGRVLMTPFPANTVEGLVHLLEQSKAGIALATACHKHVWSAPLELKPEIRLLEIPDITELINCAHVKHYAYDRTLAEGLDEPHLLIQTSGTTGKPKPIKLLSALLEEQVSLCDHPLIPSLTVVRHIQEDALRSRHASDNQKIAVHALVEDSYSPSLLPMSWAAGVAFTLWFPLYNNQVPIFFPVETVPTPLTPEFVKNIGKFGPKGKRNGIVRIVPMSASTTACLFILTPDVIRHLMQDEEGKDCLKMYDWLGYVGAPLDHVTGDAITAMGVRVQSIIGSTDTGLYNILLNAPEDWKIHRFPKDDHGFYLDHYLDDLYELCIKRVPKDPRNVFVVDPSMEIYSTRDLWRAAPGREGYWMNAGRVDDFVKLASMTKFNAVAIERMIDGHPAVARCVVAGDSRKATVILVEPSPELGPYDNTPSSEIIERVWPAIEAANEHLFPEAKLTKALVVITNAGKPIIKTAKGTVSRRSTLEIYEKKIDEAYAAAGYEPVPFTITGEAIEQVKGHGNGHTNGHA